MLRMLRVTGLGVCGMLLLGSAAQATSTGHGRWQGHGHRIGQTGTAYVELAPDPVPGDRRVAIAERTQATPDAVAAMRAFAAVIQPWVNRIASFTDPRVVDKSCLASAIYFEARSESRRGQLAVATVILNRVKASAFPSSICGVVYQGASRLNACQFSFACDGKSDAPLPGRAWDTAIAVADEAMNDDRVIDDERLKTVATATFYHADYVRPSWFRSLNRLARIGHHIFYSQS